MNDASTRLGAHSLRTIATATGAADLLCRISLEPCQSQLLPVEPTGRRNDWHLGAGGRRDVTTTNVNANIRDSLAKVKCRRRRGKPVRGRIGLAVAARTRCITLYRGLLAHWKGPEVGKRLLGASTRLCSRSLAGKVRPRI